MIKGRRLSDLTAKELENFYEFIANNKQDPSLLSLIEDNFGIHYRESSLRYVLRLCNRKYEQKKVREDTLMMNKWNKEIETKEEKPYAELLDDLFQGTISQQEFDSKVLAKNNNIYI